MVRSMKPTIKKQEVKQTVDQDTLDNLKYLGDLEEIKQQDEQRKQGGGGDYSARWIACITF